MAVCKICGENVKNIFKHRLEAHPREAREQSLKNLEKARAEHSRRARERKLQKKKKPRREGNR